MMAAHMGWSIVEEEGWRKGPWTSEEDRLLIECVRLHGEGRWNSVARVAGLKRNGKSCRLRWVNYLRPDLKRGQITPQEESIILQLHARWGNRWSTIARSLPGRTDNEIKNYWRTHFKKKAKVPSDASEKAKTRLLQRQQFQQKQQLQQQQQLQLFNQEEIKRIMALLDENDSKISSCSPQAGQGMQDNDISSNTAYPSQIRSEEEGLFYSMMNVNNVPHDAEASSSEESFLWDGLWNLDDVHANFTTSACATGKATTYHNFVVPLS